MIGRLAYWWRERQRSTDIELLWPICRQKTADLEEARMVFAMHCFMDPAWIALGDVEICVRIDALQ